MGVENKFIILLNDVSLVLYVCVIVILSENCVYLFMYFCLENGRDVLSL